MHTLTRLPALHLPRRYRLPAGPGWSPLDAGEAVRPLTLWDPVYLGRDTHGGPVTVTMASRMLLAGGLPDAGKSNGVNQILGHAALCPAVELWLFDGKENELNVWAPLAARVVGHDMTVALDAIGALRRLLDTRLGELEAAGLEKVTPDSGHGFVLVVVDELALYTSVYGEPAEQKRFSTGLRDIVARGRAAGLVVVAATQRPSSDIVPTSLRDLFAYRWALACANDASSDIILGDGYASDGYSAATIDLDGHAGVGYLLAENRRTPRLFRAAYTPRADLRTLVAAGLALRGLPPLRSLTGGAR